MCSLGSSVFGCVLWGVKVPLAPIQTYEGWNLALLATTLRLCNLTLALFDCCFAGNLQPQTTIDLRMSGAILIPRTKRFVWHESAVIPAVFSSSVCLCLKGL